MKSKISLMMVLIFAFTGTAFAAFSDVDESHIYSEAIDYVESRGIVEGYPDGTYKPDQPINRVEFTKIIIATEFTESQIENCNSVSFSDVPDGAWYTHYVCVAEMNDIVDGYPDGTYQPPNLITFAEASKIITNTLVEPTTEGSEIWYRPYVKKLENINAIPTTVEDFEHKVTRGEMAEMIYRIEEEITNLDSKTYDELAENAEDDGTVSDVTFELTATNYEFSETELPVDRGDTVTIVLTNELGRHNWVLEGYDVATLTINSGQTTEVTFVADKVGTFEYYCNVANHRELGMVGNLIVE